MSPQRGVLLFIMAALTGSAPLHAQSTISGRVLDAEGRPVPGVEVLLHAITGTSGSQVDKDSSRMDGGFDLRVDSVDSNSVYFVAVTHEGQLFMGDMLRPPFPSGQEYIVRVGINPVDFGAGATTAPVSVPIPENDSRTAGVVVIAIAVLVIGSVTIVALRRRPPEQRRLLVELARIEDEIGAADNPNATLEKRRQELRDRLLDRSTG